MPPPHPRTALRAPSHGRHRHRQRRVSAGWLPVGGDGLPLGVEGDGYGFTYQFVQRPVHTQTGRLRERSSRGAGRSSPASRCVPRAPTCTPQCLTPLPPSHTDLRSRIRITVSARLDRDTRAGAPQPAPRHAPRAEAAEHRLYRCGRRRSRQPACERPYTLFMEMDRGFGNWIDARAARRALFPGETRSACTHTTSTSSAETLAAPLLKRAHTRAGHGVAP